MNNYSLGLIIAIQVIWLTATVGISAYLVRTFGIAGIVLANILVIISLWKLPFTEKFTKKKREG